MGCTYGQGGADVLGKDNALRLDDTEVDQLVDITEDDVESLAGNSVVAAGTKLAGESSVQNGLASNLSGDSDAKDHPGKLEAISQHIQVPNRKNEGDGGEVGERGGT